MMRSIDELGLDLKSVEVRKKVVNFLTGIDVRFKHPTLDSIDCRGRVIGYRNKTGRPDFSLLMLAVRRDFPFGWWQLDEFDTLTLGGYSEKKKVFAHISDIQTSGILADVLLRSVNGNN